MSEASDEEDSDEEDSCEEGSQKDVLDGDTPAVTHDRVEARKAACRAQRKLH